ncbi:hypothetical protein ACI3KS_11140 [Microbacterium sp. ZW T5_45]|uniref:hypothetical protein n=1 Tax=Microbacterium sp. ZW T5_45 TaxID=3378080 RepID=UPI003852A1A6
MERLVPLLVQGVWHDPEGVHDSLWVDVLQRLMDEGTAPLQSAFNEAAEKARRFPAFIALAVMGMTALRRGRDDLLIRLSTEPECRNIYDSREMVPAAQELHYLKLANEDWVKQLPRWGTTRCLYPASHLFSADLRGYFKESISRDDEYTECFQTFEYRLGLIQEKLPGRHAISGEYAGERSWDGEVPRLEKSFRRQLERSRQIAKAWESFHGGADPLERSLVSHREVLKRYERW